MSKLSIAVVGAGHLGRIHARLLAAGEHGELHSIVDPIQPAREALASQHNVPCYAACDEIIDQIDAVIIAAPTVHHANVAHRLIDAGKHVLIEKPLAASAEEAA